MKETNTPQPSQKLYRKQRNAETLLQSNGKYTNEHQHINAEQINAHSACPKSSQSSVPIHMFPIKQTIRNQQKMLTQS